MRGRVYKIEVSVLDLEGMTEEDVINELQRSRHVHPIIESIDSRPIENFHDDHPLNKRDTRKAALEELFRT